jgi:hypothetical protein
VNATLADDAQRFAMVLGGRNPKLLIFQAACPDASIWQVIYLRAAALLDFVAGSGAREVTRLMLGFFEVTPGPDTMSCALASGDEELVREIWVHSEPELRSICLGVWLSWAASLQFDVAFR